MKKNVRLLLRSIGIAAMFGAAFALGACSEDAPMPEEQGEVECASEEASVDPPSVVPIERSRDIALSQEQEALMDIIIDKSFKLCNMYNQMMKEIEATEPSSEPYDNMVISPIGHIWPMVMVANGARGESQSQIIDGLGFSGHSLDEINGLFRHLAHELVSLDPTTRFNVANSVWSIYTVKEYLRDEFVNDMENIFDAPITFLDSFSEEKGGVKINDWASRESDGFIDNFLYVSGGDEATLALANLLHFKSNWVHPFELSKTADATFYNEDGTESTVAMMEMRMTILRKYSTDKYLALRLPYGNEAFAMTVIMPRTDIDDCINDICENTYGIVELSKEHARADDHVLRMPKFDITYRTGSGRVFRQLGIEDVFDRKKADLSGIFNLEELLKKLVNQRVYNVFQTCRISVDEERTEAGEGSYALCWSDKNLDPFIVTLDHPFLFIISERSTGLPLFMGRVTKM